MRRPRRQLGVAIAIGLVCTVTLGARAARAESDAELREIIREQQRQIDELSHKVDAVTI